MVVRKGAEGWETEKERQKSKKMREAQHGEEEEMEKKQGDNR